MGLVRINICCLSCSGRREKEIEGMESVMPTWKKEVERQRKELCEEEEEINRKSESATNVIQKQMRG